MKQALEYLDSPSSKLWPAGTQYNIITALRLAIEQAERQEPDGYGYARRLAEAIFRKHFAHEEHYASGRIVWQPLDTTAGVISQIDNMTCRLIAPPQQENQEPVAWIRWDDEENYYDVRRTPPTQENIDYLAKWNRPAWVPAYPHPPQRQPLTEIAEALRRHGLTLVETAKGYDVMKLGQITAHGIGGKHD